MFGKLTKGYGAWRLWSRAYDLVTKWGKNVPENDTQSMLVGVKSAWLSKVNWAAAGSFLIAVFDFLGKALSATDQQTIMDLIKNANGWQDIATAVLSIGIIVARTWFTKNMTKSVAKNGSGR